MIPRFSPDYHWSDVPTFLLPVKRGAVRALEEGFRRRTEHAEAVAFRYGRSGLYFLLKALGARDKKVILPAYTCVVVAHAVVRSGNIPVFLDNAPGKLQPSPTSYLDAIDARTAMVVPTHLFGIAEETAELCMELRKRHPGVFILQDCAHSFFSRDSSGRKVTDLGDGALFGMNISKLVNSVRGGMLTLRDPRLAEQVRAVFRAEGATGSSRRRGSLVPRAYAIAASVAFTRSGYEVVHWLQSHTPVLDSEVKYYDSAKIDLPADFDQPMRDFEAQVGLQSLERFDTRVRRRSEIASTYSQLLARMGLDSLWYPDFSPGFTWSHFPILVPGSRRDKLCNDLQTSLRAEIGKIVDYSIPDLVAYREHASCPRASDAAKKVLNLPLGAFHPDFPERIRTILERALS